MKRNISPEEIISSTRAINGQHDRTIKQIQRLHNYYGKTNHEPVTGLSCSNITMLIACKRDAYITSLLDTVAKESLTPSEEQLVRFLAPKTGLKNTYDNIFQFSSYIRKDLSIYEKSLVLHILKDVQSVSIQQVLVNYNIFEVLTQWLLSSYQLPQLDFLVKSILEVAYNIPVTETIIKEKVFKFPKLVTKVIKIGSPQTSPLATQIKEKWMRILNKKNDSIATTNQSTTIINNQDIPRSTTIKRTNNEMLPSKQKQVSIYTNNSQLSRTTPSSLLPNLNLNTQNNIQEHKELKNSNSSSTLLSSINTLNNNTDMTYNYNYIPSTSLALPLLDPLHSAIETQMNSIPSINSGSIIDETQSFTDDLSSDINSNNNAINQPITSSTDTNNISIDHSKEYKDISTKEPTTISNTVIPALETFSILSFEEQQLLKKKNMRHVSFKPDSQLEQVFIIEEEENPDTTRNNKSFSARMKEEQSNEAKLFHNTTPEQYKWSTPVAYQTPISVTSQSVNDEITREKTIPAFFNRRNVDPTTSDIYMKSSQPNANTYYISNNNNATSYATIMDNNNTTTNNNNTNKNTNSTTDSSLNIKSPSQIYVQQQSIQKAIPPSNDLNNPHRVSSPYLPELLHYISNFIPLFQKAVETKKAVNIPDYAIVGETIRGKQVFWEDAQKALQYLKDNGKF
ncbi:hypothetical protein WA158_001164 [Blastocystis sp. Blastoise]